MKTQLEDLIKEAYQAGQFKEEQNFNKVSFYHFIKDHKSEIEALLKLKEAEAEKLYDAGWERCYQEGVNGINKEIKITAPDFKTFYKNYTNER